MQLGVPVEDQHHLLGLGSVLVVTDVGVVCCWVLAFLGLDLAVGSGAIRPVATGAGPGEGATGGCIQDDGAW